MVRPKMLGDVQSLTNSAQNKEYFSSKYSLRAKAGGNDGLVIGQDIFCIPLVSNGVYELPVHTVKTRGNKGFKSKYNCYIQCHGVNEATGEHDPNCVCCQAAQAEWDKFVENNKKGETLISFKSSRFYIPVILLGNETGSKTAKDIPISKLTMAGRDFSYVELSQKSFNEMIAQFKNDLLNNGRMEYGLEGADLYNEIMKQLSKHILKISINKPDSVGTHKKIYSFISFDNKNIGAETGSYRNITEGLTGSKKLQAEVEEFITLFENELESVLMPWTDAELTDYINGVTNTSSAEKEAEYAKTGTVPQNRPVQTPKEEQIVIEENSSSLDDIDEDDDLFDGQPDSGADILLDDEPTSTSNVEIEDEDMSFDMDEEDFFGDD